VRQSLEIALVNGQKTSKSIDFSWFFWVIFLGFFSCKKSEEKKLKNLLLV